MLRSGLLWQLASSQIALAIGAGVLPALVGPGPAVPIVIAGLVAAWLLARRVVGRISQVTATARAQLPKLAPAQPSSGDELAALANAVDQLARHAELIQSQWRRADDAAQKARAAADNADRARTDFLAILSHEVRTPLNGIMGMTQLALQTAPDGAQREYLEIVRSSADFLLAIINDLRDFARLEAGGLSFQSVRFPLRHTLADVLKLLGLRAHQKGLELVYRVAPDVPDLLEGDPDRLRQLLVNLLTNAIDFTDRGEVVLGVERAPDRGSKTEITLTASFALILLHFQVRDTGVGIPPEKLAALFDRPPGAEAAGSLGMNIARQLVEGMGGRLWAESVPGQGSTFHFTARLQIARETGPDPASAPTRLAGTRVLLVDDNATSRGVLAELLASWQLQPTAVGTASEALAALEQAAAAGSPWQLAVIDSHMPETDGFTLVEQLRCRPAGAGLPMLILVAGHHEDAVRCRQLRIPAHVMKPLHPAELLPALSKALNIAEPVPPPQPAPGAGTPAPLRVLVAEGNPVHRQLAVIVLEKLGHRVAQATTGAEVRAVVDQRAADLLLLDPSLPDPPGLEIVAGIRQDEKSTGRHLPIIALIPYGQPEARERCRAAGVDSYVSQPLQMQELVRAIESVRPAASTGSP